MPDKAARPGNQPPDVSPLVSRQMDVFKQAIADAVAAAADGDENGFDAAFAQLSQISQNSSLDIEAVLNSMHVPKDAGELEPEIRDMLARIPDGWGRWLGVSRGWYPLVVETHRKLLKLFPTYEIHQVKEKYGTLRYYWGEGDGPYERAHPRPPRPADDSEQLEHWKKKVEEWYQLSEQWYESPEGKAITAELDRRRALAAKIEEEAERMSEKICDTCGQPGHLTVSGGWYRTCCLACADGTGFEYCRDSLCIEDEAELPHLSTNDAERVIAKIKAADEEPQLVTISLYQRSRRGQEHSLGTEFIKALLDWVADQRSKTAAEWGADDRMTVDFTHLNDASRELLSAELKVRGLEDRALMRQREAERIAAIRDRINESSNDPNRAG